jgi:hypothetical protein
MFAQRPHETPFLFLLRWAARITSAVSIALILLFAFGENWQFSDVRWEEWGVVLLFPLGLVSGLILGWQEEIKGGILAVGSVVLFYLVYGLALTGSIGKNWWFALFALPGILYLVHGMLSRRVIGGTSSSIAR